MSDHDPASGTDLAGLPRIRTSFVGREAERAAVHAALDEARLVTLVGPGGVGKSRLAAAVVSEAGSAFPSGSAFADLASVRPDFLAEAIAAVLGVTERPGQPLEQALNQRLGHGRCLLVVNSCEHLLATAAGLVGRLLTECPSLVVLATSRVPFGIPGERVLPVPPLSLTGRAPHEAGGAEAVTLFLDRAREADGGFGVEPDVAAELCARLNGMALPIELAAARAGLPGLAGLRATLKDRAALTGSARAGDGADKSDVVLRTVLDWSYEQLDDNERRLFRQLGVFARGFDLDAASAVVADGDRDVAAGVAGRLVARGLLVPDYDVTSRWYMLGPIRRYALDRLGAVPAETREEAECRGRYLGWALTTAADLECMLEADQPWQPQFDLVADDLRAALHDLVSGPAPGQGAAAHKLARALGHLCYARRFLLEGRRHFQRAAACAPGAAAAAADLRAAADVALAEHRGEIAFGLARESAQRAKSAGDATAQAIALAFAVCIGSRFPATFTSEVPHHQLCELLDEAKRVAPEDDPLVAAYLVAADAWNATGLKTVPDAGLAQQALQAARAAADPALISAALDAVSSGLGTKGRFRAAHELSHERLQLFDQMPRHNPRTGVEIIDTLHVTPLVAVAAGDLPRAVQAAQRAWDDPFSGLYMRASKFVVPLALCGRFDEALEYAAIMWENWQRVGSPTARWMAPAVHGAALVHGLRGQGDSHREWLSRARKLAPSRKHDEISDSFAAFAEARVALRAGAIDDAMAAAVDLSSTPPWHATGHQFFDSLSWAIAAEVAVAVGLPDAGAWLETAAPAGAQSAWAAACLARASGCLHKDLGALRESLAGWDRIDARFERACTLLLLPGRAAEGLAEFASLGCQPPGRQYGHGLGDGDMTKITE